VSNFKDKSCCTRFTDCFLRSPPQAKVEEPVEQTPAKDQMVQDDEESGKKEDDTNRQIVNE